MSHTVLISKKEMRKICRSVIKDYMGNTSPCSTFKVLLQQGFIEKYTCTRAKKVKVADGLCICYEKGEKAYRIGEKLT